MKTLLISAVIAISASPLCFAAQQENGKADYNRSHPGQSLLDWAQAQPNGNSAQPLPGTPGNHFGWFKNHKEKGHGPKGPHWPIAPSPLPPAVGGTGNGSTGGGSMDVGSTGVGSTGVGSAIAPAVIAVPDSGETAFLLCAGALGLFGLSRLPSLRRA